MLDYVPKLCRSDRVLIQSTQEMRDTGLAGRRAVVEKLDRWGMAHLTVEGHQRIMAVPVKVLQRVLPHEEHG